MKGNFGHQGKKDIETAAETIIPYNDFIKRLPGSRKSSKSSISQQIDNTDTFDNFIEKQK
jgi:hypothetical protein